MPDPNVVVIGDTCVDMVIQLPDRSVNAPDLKESVPQLHGGGTAANVAVALVRLGLPVAMVGTVGDDGYGRWLREDLISEGVDVHGLTAVHDAFTPMIMALIEPDGERHVVVWPPTGGADQQLRADAIDPTLISSASWLHTTGIGLRASPVREAVLHAMEMARAARVLVSIDLNARMELWDMDDETQRAFARAIELADVVFGNAEEEIMPLADADSPINAAQSLADDKRIVVARQGSEGALVVTPQATFHAPAFNVEVVDTLGAGDAFDGGFIAGWLAGGDVHMAARWGNAVAALQIGQTGARGAPCFADVQQILSQSRHQS